MPGLFVIQLVIIQSWSKGYSQWVMTVWLLVMTLCKWKVLHKSSVQEMFSCNNRPAVVLSKSSSTEMQWGPFVRGPCILHTSKEIHTCH